MQTGNYHKQQGSEAVTCGILLSYHRIAQRQLDPWGMRVSPRHFAEHLAALKQFGTPVSLPDFVESLQSGDLPYRSIILTFDDGYLDNLTRALPMLDQHDVPATIFVTTGFSNQAGFWWDQLEAVFLRPNRLPDSLTLALEDGTRQWKLGEAAMYSRGQYVGDCKYCTWKGESGTRIRFYHDIYDALWPLPHQRRLDLVGEIVEWSGVDVSGDGKGRPLTLEEIGALGKHELITIGAHTVNHLPLSTRPAQIQEKEILHCRDALQSILNVPVTTFAYPHGKYNTETITLVKKAGFQCACTTQQAPVRVDADLMQLPRYAVQDWNGEEFVRKLEQWIS